METTEIQLHSLDLFLEGGAYINCSRLYYTYFKKVPSIKTIGKISLTKLRKWLETEWKDKIVSIHAKQQYSRDERQLRNIDVFYLLENNILLNLEFGTVRILHDPSQEELAKELLLEFRRFTKREYKTQEICLVVNSRNGLDTTAIKIKKPLLDLTTHYNDDLLPLHEKMLKTLKQKDKSGLYLFHGIPGTGKSTYIRYLIRSINKKVIFMPPGLAGNLDAPNVASLLIENANCVFVIEDAEELLTSRDAGKNSSISMLLNLTDGLLGESLGIQVIATFNTDLQNIDKALLRKGRLLALYEFKALEMEKSVTLLKQLGCTGYMVRQPMTLADIFNTKDETYHFKSQNRPQIGFLSSAG